MAQNNQQGGNQPNPNPGQDRQQEQQDPARRQQGDDRDADKSGNQGGRNDENRQNR